MFPESEASPETDLRFADQQSMDRWIRSLLRNRRCNGPAVFLDSQLPGHVSGGPGYIASDPVAQLRVEMAGDGSSWEQLRNFRLKHPDWMFGWLAYDLKNDSAGHCSANPDPVGLPDLFFFVPGLLLQVDRNAASINLIRGSIPRTMEEDGRIGGMELGRVASAESRDEYVEKVIAAKEFIRSGDTYEVNLTRQLRGPFR